MAVPNPNDMEEFQRLSDQYQPEIEGPLIGVRLPMSELVTEYALADPTYIAKTQSLAREYVAYRRIKGDGQCGWRAAVFGYFEMLYKSGDPTVVEQELVRIRSFETIIRSAGGDYDILVDLFEYTWELFEEILKTVKRQIPDENCLLDILNESVKSDSIVYHFKMMTSSYMALHPDDFEPFLDEPLLQYRQTKIDAANQEIEQVGLQALTTGVIAPAGIGLEVLYLDRSAGDEVTLHGFVDVADNVPVIRLLYRPGHYDLIYKDDKPVTVFFQSRLQTGQPSSIGDQNDSLESYHLFPFSDTHSLNNVSFGEPSQYGRANPPSAYPSPYHVMDYSTSSQQYNTPMSYVMSPDAHLADRQQYFSPVPQHPSHSSSPPFPPSHVLLGSVPMTGVQEQGFPAMSEPQIRFSTSMPTQWNRQMHRPLDARSVASFAQSQASFCNSRFQPEMWNAEQEYK